MLPRAKLCKTPFNGSGINGTHKCEVRRLGIGDGKMVKESRDSIRKNKFIMSRRILIDIYKGEYKMKRKVNRHLPWERVVPRTQYPE